MMVVSVVVSLENAPIDCLFFQLCPKIMATTGSLPYRKFWVIKGILELFNMVLLANFRKWSFKWGDRIHRDQLLQYLCLKISENPEKVS